MEFVEIPAMMVEQLVDVQLVTGSMVVGVVCVETVAPATPVGAVELAVGMA